jgi:hypothetical protein
MNWYAYVAGNSIGYIDPSGLQGARVYSDAVLQVKAEKREVTYAAIDGAQAFADGVIPFVDPLASLDFYDPSDKALQTSQFIGGATRDIVTVLGGGALGSVARAEGISTTFGQRVIMAEFGPGWVGLVTGEGITTTGLVIDYTIKTAGRISSLMDLNDLLNDKPPSNK